MNNLLPYLGLCVVLVLGAGCAITDYPVIVDKYSGETVNTNGKAMIANTSQVVTVFSDGADNLFTMIDQKANGDGVLTTYNFYTTDGTYFLDHDYCTPDWNGCAIVTAPNGGYYFDRTWNWNCSGIRSICIYAATPRYGECGRGMTPLEKASLISEFASDTGFEVVVNRHNTHIANQDSQIVQIYGTHYVTGYFGAGTTSIVVDASSAMADITATKFREDFQGMQTFKVIFNGRSAGEYNVLID
jgi:hypothetical protein